MERWELEELARQRWEARERPLAGHRVAVWEALSEQMKEELIWREGRTVATDASTVLQMSYPGAGCRSSVGLE